MANLCVRNNRRGRQATGRSLDRASPTDKLRQSRLGRSGSTARLPQLVRSISDAGFEADGS
jgi:hypothetical protein